MLDTQTSSRSRTLTLRPERAARPTFARIDDLRSRVTRGRREPELGLRPFEPLDLSHAIDLARRAYGLGLVIPCVETLRQHAAARQIGFDDGRLLFTASRDDVMIGVCGLHRYIWGPSDIAWLSWFFVAPEARNSTVGLWMFSELLDISQTMGLRALYVETPNGGEEYANVYRYLPRLGFERQACLPNYYANGTDMLILMLPLLPRERS